MCHVLQVYCIEIGVLCRVQNRNFEAVANLGECPLGGTGPGHLALVRIFIYTDNMHWYNKHYLFRGKYMLFIHVSIVSNKTKLREKLINQIHNIGALMRLFPATIPHPPNGDFMMISSRPASFATACFVP